MTGSSIFAIRAGIRQFRRTVDLGQLPIRRRHAVENPRRRRDQVHVVLALEPLLHDLHVQQAEEAAAESEPQCDRCLGLPEEGRVVQAQFLERLTQLRVFASFHRIQAGKNHRLAFLEAGKGFEGRARGFGDGVADLRVGHRLDAGENESDLADAELDRPRSASVRTRRPGRRCTPAPSPSAGSSSRA